MVTLSRSHSRGLILSAIALLCFCSGCTTVSESGGTTTVGYAAWVPLLIALVGFGVIGWGYLSMFRDSDDDDDNSNPATKGILTMLGGGIVVLFVAPAFIIPAITIGADKTVISGSMLWFVPSSTTIDYNRVTDMRTEVKERWTRRGRRTTETLVIQYSDGQTERMTQSTLVDAALPHIANAIQNRQNGGNAAAIAAMNPAMPGMGNPAMPNPAGANPAGANPAGAPTGFDFGGPTSATANATTPAPLTIGANPGGNSNSSNPQGQPITNETPLAVGGSILGQAKDGKWYPSRVTEVLADGSVKIHYEAFPAEFDEIVPRTRIRLAEAAGNSPMTTFASATTPNIPQTSPNPFPTAGSSPFPQSTGVTAQTVAGTSPAVSPSPGTPTQPMNVGSGTPTATVPDASVPGTFPANTVEATLSNLKQGQSARAFWGATWYNVKILTVLPDKTAKIHYDGYADSFDEVVPLTKLRLPK